MYTIYGLCDPRDQQLRYIGVTKKGIEQRLKEHIVTNDKTHRSFWVRNLRDAGLTPEPFEIEKVEKSWQESEKFWIAYFKFIGASLTNGTDGGDGIPNPTKEMKNKVSIANKGRKHSEETKKKLSLAKKGRRFSESHKAKIRDANIGRKFSAETRKKMSVARKLRITTEETRKKLSIALLGNKRRAGKTDSLYGGA